MTIFSAAFENHLFGPLLIHLDIGVPFFFLLSAFLLYRPFLEARVEGHSRRSFSAYAKRRFVRIAPAYWLVLTVAAIVPGFAGAFSGNWWVYYGLLQSYPVYTPQGSCATNSYECGVPVAWSLTIEVGFYILLPLFVLLMAWLGSRLSRVPWLRLELAVVAALTAISVAILSQSPDSDLIQWLFFSPLGRGWWFGLGLLLAALSVWAAERDREPAFVDFLRRRPLYPLAIAATLYVAECFAMRGSLLAFPLTTQLEYTSQYLIVGLIAALVLAPAIFGVDGGGWPRRLLAHRALVWLGLVSYGVFLWQLPVLIGLIEIGVLDLTDGLRFPLLLVTTLAGTLTCAAISYYALERPLMRWVRRRRDDRGGPPRRFRPGSARLRRVAGADDVP